MRTLGSGLRFSLADPQTLQALTSRDGAENFSKLQPPLTEKGGRTFS
jgi:hypothetical protein